MNQPIKIKPQLSPIFRKWLRLHYCQWIGMALFISGCSTLKSIPDLLPSEFPQIEFPQIEFPQIKSSRPTTPLLPVQSVTTQAMEAQVHQQINKIRQKQGLAALKHNEELAQVARNYSRQMAEQKFFSHTSPDGGTLEKRVRSAGIFYVMVGENLFTSTNIPQPVPVAIAGWMDSPRHRQNILRTEYRETGVGVWQAGNTYYFTQLFMRSVSL